MSKLGTLRMYLRRSPTLDEPTDLYAHTVRLLDGGELDLASWRGHPALIVNTASKCGLTPQYEGLQSVYEAYRERGLNILGSPSGDFADQEFEESGEIGDFCQRNYGVTFPLTELTSVRAEPDALWRDLSGQPNSAPPTWNFTKYLVGGDGRLIRRFGPNVTPEDARIHASIEAALTAAAGSPTDAVL